MLRCLEQPLINDTIDFKYNASNNLMQFVFRREDSEILGAVNNGGYLQLQLATALPSSAGDVVYVKFNTNAYTSGVYEVVSQPGVYSVVVNIPYVVGAVGTGAFINNLSKKSGYRTESLVYVNGQYAVTLNNQAAQNGEVHVDVSGVVNSFVEFYNNYTYHTICEPNTSISGKFSIQIREAWDAHLVESYDSYGDYYYIGAVMPILNEEDGVMKQFTPFQSSESEAKFLCEFEQPSYFRGYPFDLSFIYSDRFDSSILSRQEDRFDNYGNLDSHLANNLSNHGRYYVNRMKIYATYPEDVTELDVWLDSVASKGASFDIDFDYDFDTVDLLTP